MLSSSLRYRPAEFPGTSFLHRYPAKVSLLFWQAHHRNYPAESTPFTDSAGGNQQDGWAELSCYSVFIIVSDYKFSICFTSRQTSACYFELLYPRRIRFAPKLKTSFAAQSWKLRVVGLKQNCWKCLRSEHAQFIQLNLFVFCLTGTVLTNLTI